MSKINRHGIDHLVFAGPRQHKTEVGGVVYLFEDLIRGLRCDQIIDTNSKNYRSQAWMVLQFAKACLRAWENKAEIALHGTAKDYQYLGLILLISHWLLGLRYHCRKFGGDFDKAYEQMHPIWRWVTAHFLQCSRVSFFETQALVRHFSRFNQRTYWLPNYRPAVSLRTPNEFHGKFVFVGHVRKEKGIDEILVISDMLPNNWTIDIYGPLMGYEKDDFSRRGLLYKGILEPQQVCGILANYNGLLLPTFWDGEGYPGVVIEAFSVGLPVVTSTLPGLKELVREACGRFIEPHSAESLLGGMTSVAADYKAMRAAAVDRFRLFERERVLGEYLALVSGS
jgi:glycosyltransferase involved in cell wall biosynthesis